MQILDGKATAAAVRADVAAATKKLVDGHGVTPGLAVVLVGEDPASQVYVRNKDKDATEAGFAAQTIKLPAETAEADLVAEVERLNADPAVHGILVQLPLPDGLDADAVVPRIAPEKDVDGLTPASVAALVMGRDGHQPCTPSGCIEMMDRAASRSPARTSSSSAARSSSGSRWRSWRWRATRPSRSATAAPPTSPVTAAAPT